MRIDWEVRAVRIIGRVGRRGRGGKRGEGTSELQGEER